MDLRQRFFQYRSYSPVPFLLVMVVFAHPTMQSIGIGMGIILVGEFLRLWGVSIAGSETRTTGPVGGTFLITRGPFAHVRNPLYVGNMLIYCGVGVMSMALFPWLVIVAFAFFLVQYTLIISIEEEYLTKAFGDEYKRYMKSVPRLLPRITPYASGENVQPDLDWARGIVSEKSTLLAIVTVTVIVVARMMFAA